MTTGFGASPRTAISDWEHMMRSVGEQTSLAYDLVQRANRIYATNTINAIIGQTPAGKMCGDSTLSHDAACAAKAFADAFKTFMETVMTIPDIKPGGMAADEMQTLGIDPAAMPQNLSPLQITDTRPRAPYVAPNAIPTMQLDARFPLGDPPALTDPTA